MKISTVYFFIFFSALSLLQAQQKQFELYKGNCQLFGGNVYCYGLAGQKQHTLFCIYKLDFKLNTLDSFKVEAGKTAVSADYLRIYSDTLHDHLNVYLQKKEKKTVTVLRFNKKFELIAHVENVDIARLNNTAMLGSEPLYFKKEVYSVKTETDTSGKQFYLNKYILKSERLNFDYEFKWQFAFERKNIRSAHLFYADKDFVFLYVTIDSGIKAGEWILKINAATAKLEKATKINSGGETNTYLFGSCLSDKNYKSLTLVGQKFTAAQLDLKENKLSISNSAFATLYYLEIDSLGEIITKQDFKIPINDIKTGVKKTANSYLLRPSALTRTPDGGLSFTGDVFKGMNSNLCYNYVNTIVFNLMPSEDKLALEKSSIAPNVAVENFYTTTDKLDMNGKLCIDSLNQLETLFYKPLTFPVKQQFKSDEEKNPLWVLSKHTVKKNGVTYSFLSPVKKIYQLTPIEEMNESGNPAFLALSAASFIISSEPEEGKFQLKLYNW